MASVSLGGMDVARIGLGTNRLHRTPENVAFVREAVAAGIGLFDTAHTYAGGESEETIGAALSPRSRRHGVLVATKGGWGVGEGRPEALRAQIDESLRRLQTEVIDLYYLHRVDPETPLEDSVGTIKEAVAAGKVRLAGLSQVDVDKVERARQVLPIAAVQNHYSLSERKHDGVVDYCEKEGIVFVPFFPLRDVSSETLDRVAQNHGATPAQVALAWLLRRSPCILPIPGTLSIEHLRDNVRSPELHLSEEEFEALR